MTGEAFIDALRAKIDPETITAMTGNDKAISVTLSTGRVLEVKRKKVRELDDAADYLDRLLA